MCIHTRYLTSVCRRRRSLAKPTMTVLIMLRFLTLPTLFTTLASLPSHAQTYSVIHNFTGGQDGRDPWAGPTLDSAGNLYGTAYQGGSSQYGIVYKLSHRGSSWVLTPVYSFTCGTDGGFPVGAVTIGPDGTLFGTNTNCGTHYEGTVFNLRPQPTACTTALCAWNEISIYQFSADWPTGNLVFDRAGNLYGTTTGVFLDFGTVFELTHSAAGWAETDIYDFDGLGDGGYPGIGLALDGLGNLYGTTYVGGTYGGGTVFELTRSGSSWTQTILYSFQDGDDGHGPWGGVTRDRAGNLFGSTWSGANGVAGIVYELTPASGGWSFTLLHTFTGNGGGGPRCSLTLDGSGSLYGTTANGGTYEQGSVFKLTPSAGGWIFTDLYDFTGGSDGGEPYGSVAVDANGNLYGTTTTGGAYAWGVIWEITP